MPSAVAIHSHRPTTKVVNKSFKSKKATKGALRDQAKGKVPNEKGQRKTPHQQVMSKFDRRNQAKQRQLVKYKEHQKETSIFSGRDGAPRIVAVVPLCADSDVSATIRSLNNSLDIEAEIAETSFRVPIDRFKQKLQYVPVKRDLATCMDAARIADFVIFVLSSEVEVDPLGELIIRSIENQGMPTLFTVVQNLDNIQPAKARPDVVKSLASFMTHFHPGQDKIYNLDSRQECANLMRSLCNTTPKGIHWRDQRSWMLVDEIKWPAIEKESTVLTGVVRGKGLKADRLVHVGDWGTFQIEKITAAPAPTKKRKDGGMAVDEEETENILETPDEDQDDLAELAPRESRMDDADADDGMPDSLAATSKKGVLLDDHHYFSEDEREEYAPPKKLPKGTSSYQAAWFLDDVSDSESDLDDEEMTDAVDERAPAAPEDGMDGVAANEPTEAAMSEYPQSEMFVEPNEDDDAAQLEEYRARKRDEAEEDKEFPDEIELHPNVIARERLAKYRGLKSLRTSPWNTEEDRPYEPEEWSRLLQISDYQSSRNRSIREALVGGVAPGTRVHVHLKGVSKELEKSYNPSRPVTLFSLLRHENKKTSLNFDVTHKEDYEKSIKSKEELIVQCGPRRFIVNPLFSTGGNTENNVHKYCRYLHPGQSAIASFMGPTTWGAVPTLFFKRTTPEEASEGVSVPLQLVATGTARAPSTSRVVAKRVILTGHPYHIHKKVVTVRYMFFNREDVEWFKALPLWTKRGRTGYIKESLGTHGYFKANFDGRINPQDAVGVSLYKRVWPRSARPLTGPLLEQEAFGSRDDEAMDEDIH
ncbi:AARP2CN domain-containing protein [Xylariaceae sp. FL0662B]|nr:AARP2CN domain-containing protein [Xylariaceae sp. FL0662B]